MGRARKVVGYTSGPKCPGDGQIDQAALVLWALFVELDVDLFCCRFWLRGLDLLVVDLDLIEVMIEDFDSHLRQVPLR